MDQQDDKPITLQELAEDILDEVKHLEQMNRPEFKLNTIGRIYLFWSMMDRRLKEMDRQIRQENF
jgi:hypothetical protein